MNIQDFNRLVAELDFYPTESESLTVKNLNAEFIKTQWVVLFSHQAKQLELLASMAQSLEKIQAQYVSERMLRKL